MNTTITKDQMLLKDNEVYVMSHETPQDNEYGYRIAPGLSRKVTHSTAKLDGVIHLQREWFVKPFDLKGMQDAFIHENALYPETDRIQDIIKSAFEDGYNAKKGEFTREQLMNVAYAASNHGMFDDEEHAEKYVRDCINHFQPLSLPEKIVLSPDGELIEIQW